MPASSLCRQHALSHRPLGRGLATDDSLQRSTAMRMVLFCCGAPANPFNFKDCTMNTRLISSLGMALLALSLAACSGMSTRDKNTAAGAAIGGVAGAVLTGGSTAGTVGGAAVGGVIGNQVDTNKK